MSSILERFKQGKQAKEEMKAEVERKNPKYTCGHTAVDAYKIPCPTCILKNRKKKTSKWVAKKKYQPGRLPDSSSFNISYDANAETWRGTLIIGNEKFESSESGVFKLLQRLDLLYRSWEKRQKPIVNN